MFCWLAGGFPFISIKTIGFSITRTHPVAWGLRPIRSHRGHIKRTWKQQRQVAHYGLHTPRQKRKKQQHRDKTDPMVCCELFLTHSEKSQNIELRRKYNAECSKTDGQTPPSYCKTKKKVNGNLPSKQLICSSRTSGRCLAWSLAIMVSTLLLFATIWNPCLFLFVSGQYVDMWQQWVMSAIHGQNLDLDPILREKMVTTGFPNWVMKDTVLSRWQKRIKTLQGAAVC